ncbi:MAG: hypothetical protein M4579_006492 [Chaenotheca gracillima]|nr:MAG: hypothetical protein M4579_006492 [Chaenotheca gracillima]
MEDSNPPTIPERTHRSKQNRRRSLPPPATRSSRASGGNRVRVQPASPEVISSLISSLSEISAPANHHFEHLPPSIGQSRSTPASPNAFQSTFAGFDAAALGDGDQPTYSSGGFGMDYGAYNSPEPRGYLHPDDAATPPVVRTSKSPSGLSPITSGSNPPSPVRSLFSRSSSKELDETASIGSLSIEPGLPPVDTRTRRSSVDSDKKSRRSYKGLMYMSSKERLREKEADRRRSSAQDTLSPVSPYFPQSLDRKPSIAEDMIKEEPGPEARGEGNVHPHASDSNRAPESPSLHDQGDGSGSPSIPNRESSLRRSGERAEARRRRSRQSPIPEDGQTGESEPLEARPGADSSNVPETHLRPLVPPSSKRGPKRDLTISTPETSRNPPRMPKSQTWGTLPSSTQAARSPVSRKFASERNLLAEHPESAPAPAIQQRINRDNGARISSLPPSTSTRISPAPEAFSSQSHGTSSGNASRSDSRQKRHSGPTSPRSDTYPRAHQRSFSNPLNRKAEPEPPQISVEDRPSTADSIDDEVSAYLLSPRLSQKIRHPQTGRIISFSEVGDPKGLAVFCCVGMGLTRYITAFYDELAATLKLRLITPDRPGVGDSEPYADGTTSPLSWPDDIYAICQSLKITKFSLLAHSAGAIYALAAALRMPQHIRGRIHLLAPWIPPSQMSVIGSQQGPAPTASVPTSQRILRALPTTFLKAANSSFMSTTSSSITSSLPKSPRRKRKSAQSRSAISSAGAKESAGRPSRDGATALRDSTIGTSKDLLERTTSTADFHAASTTMNHERQSTYDTRLTHAIWDLATTGANPAVDLLVCLERRQTIGFRYVDITRAVVIHHGSRDTRVPVENVRWLGGMMRRCEVRVLEGEGHGLMASAGVMGGVLMELAKEWEDWMKVVQAGGGGAGSRNRSPAAFGKGHEWRS